jgi:pyridoxine 5-phosphate synthase
MTQLSVNINKVALLRNTRHLDIPSVIAAARTALDAGAAGITVHPRPDERHIRISDVDDLAALLAGPPYRDAEFNIEGNPFEGKYMDIVERVRPTQCTLVPDDPGAFTSDHGWDVADQGPRLTPIIARLKGHACRVSLFMDADPAQIRHVPATGADRIELYTESYAHAYASGGGALEETFTRFAKAADLAGELGLGLNAGHDLNLDNLAHFVGLPGVREVSIGHALIADALNMGLAAAVRAYLHELGQ